MAIHLYQHNLNMINSNLEQDLKLFCKTQDNNLFEENIYTPLYYIATSICKKYKITSEQLANGIINDLVSESIIKFPEYYNEKKGTAKATIYILMSQHLLKIQRYDNANKRCIKKTVFIEDLDFDDKNKIHLIELEFNSAVDMKEILLQNKHIFNHLDTKLQRKIASTFIELIEEESVTDDYIRYIAKKFKVTIKTVYKVIKQMQNMLHLLNVG